MDFAHDIHEEKSNFVSCVMGLQHAQVNSFRKTIHHDQNGSIALIRRQAHNEVQG
jgi:hypothetical protein